MTANVPPVSVQPNAINAPISPVAIHETQFGQLTSGANGYVCLTLVGGSTWSTAGGPTFTASGGTGAVTAGPVSGGGTATLAGQVTTSSTTDPGAVFTFNNLEVNSSSTIGPVVAIVKINGTDTSCTGGVQVNRLGDTTNYGQVVVFTIGQVTVNAPIFGSNADQTAVAALEFRYPATPHTNCLPNNAPPSASQHDVGSSVVLATDQNWPDALTASYLAAYLRTGVLLTPTGSLSAYTENAIAQEGVSSVFIVGGNLAVSDGVANQLAGTQQFQCGGTVPRTDAEANPLTLNVTRIWGPTADDTAQDVSTFVNSGYVKTLNISGVPLYNGLGSNPYNNTSGKDSTDGAGAALPTIPVRTAILATDQSFQDAAAVSPMAYNNSGSSGLPILITPPGSLGSQALTGYWIWGSNRSSSRVARWRSRMRSTRRWGRTASRWYAWRVKTPVTPPPRSPASSSAATRVRSHPRVRTSTRLRVLPTPTGSAGPAGNAQANQASEPSMPKPATRPNWRARSSRRWLGVTSTPTRSPRVW